MEQLTSFHLSDIVTNHKVMRIQVKKIKKDVESSNNY